MSEAGVEALNVTVRPRAAKFDASPLGSHGINPLANSYSNELSGLAGGTMFLAFGNGFHGRVRDIDGRNFVDTAAMPVVSTIRPAQRIQMVAAASTSWNILIVRSIGLASCAIDCGQNHLC